MSEMSRVEQAGVTVSFGERFQASQQFNEIFKEGMDLVDRTAAYLDGPGRKDAKGLPPQVSVLYATESMRLTTRLLDLASWLLIRRAVKQGEITNDEARAKRQRVKLPSRGRPAHVKSFGDLPLGLRGLIEESFALHDRIVQLDRAMIDGPEIIAEGAEAGLNPVAEQLSRLNGAFGGNA